LTEEKLRHAWNLKNHGFTDAKIAEDIGISPITYSLHKAKFLIYFAKRNRELREEKEGGQARFQERLDKYRTAAVKLAELGEDQSKIARQLGIPESTLRYWMEMDETFGHAIRTAKDAADERVIRSLLRRCEGFTTRDFTVTEIRGAHDELVQRVTNKTVKRILPNTKAMELWLTNRRKWLSENQGENSNALTDERPIEYEIVDKLFNEATKENADNKEANI